MSPPPEGPQMPDQSGQTHRHGAFRDALAVFMLLACVPPPRALVFARMAHSGTSQYRFMLWNLALAWVPVLLATAIFRLATRAQRRLLGPARARGSGPAPARADALCNPLALISLHFLEPRTRRAGLV